MIIRVLNSIIIEKKESKNVLIYFHGGAFVIDTIKGLYFKMNEQILDKSSQNYEILMVDLKGKKIS